MGPIPNFVASGTPFVATTVSRRSSPCGAAGDLVGPQLRGHRHRAAVRGGAVGTGMAVGEGGRTRPTHRMRLVTPAGDDQPLVAPSVGRSSSKPSNPSWPSTAPARAAKRLASSSPASSGTVMALIFDERHAPITALRPDLCPTGTAGRWSPSVHTPFTWWIGCTAPVPRDGTMSGPERGGGPTEQSTFRDPGGGWPLRRLAVPPGESQPDTHRATEPDRGPIRRLTGLPVFHTAIGIRKGASPEAPFGVPVTGGPQGRIVVSSMSSAARTSAASGTGDRAVGDHPIQLVAVGPRSPSGGAAPRPRRPGSRVSWRRSRWPPPVGVGIGQQIDDAGRPGPGVPRSRSARVR